MPTMSAKEYERVFGNKGPEVVSVEQQEQMEKESDWRRRVARKGYLFDANGQPWRVPDDLIILYREKYPELGEDLGKFGFKGVGRASDDR